MSWTSRQWLDRLRSLQGIPLLAGVLLLFAGRDALAASTARPNILVIVSDDLGFLDVGYQPGSVVRTPNLDQLAAESVRLTDFYVFSTCSPTRAALLTSRNPSRFGILGPIGKQSTLSIPLGTTTMADVLKDRGYATAIVGKWHLGLRPQVGPRQFGFDETYGSYHGQTEPYEHLYKNGDQTWHRNDRYIEEQGHTTDLIAAEAVRWLEQKRTQPFFLYLPFTVPHTPLVEEEKWIKPYEGTIAEPSRRLYAAAITHMDDAIGQVLTTLERTGQRDNTLIFYTSDNGGPKDYFSTTDYGREFHNPVLSDNGPLRGWQGDLYEGGIRSAAFVHWRGVLQPRDIDATLSVLDWLPSVAALTGWPVPGDSPWEGINIWPVLTGEQSAPPGGPRKFYWKTNKEVGLRDGEWKLIEPLTGRASPQLFNVVQDPFEKQDQATAHPEIVSRLHALLTAERARDPAVDPESSE